MAALGGNDDWHTGGGCYFCSVCTCFANSLKLHALSIGEDEAFASAKLPAPLTVGGTVHFLNQKDHCFTLKAVAIVAEGKLMEDIFLIWKCPAERDLPPPNAVLLCKGHVKKIDHSVIMAIIDDFEESVVIGGEFLEG